LSGSEEDDSKVSSLIDEGDPNDLLNEDAEFNLEDYLKFKA